jgi:site-specific recombinase XerD
MQTYRQQHQEHPFMTAPALGTTVAFEEAVSLFTHDLLARNMSSNTIQAYATDVRQFLTYTQETTVVAETPATITRLEVTCYLSHLAEQNRTGTTRARKLAAIREFFAVLVRNGHLSSSPAEGIALPKKERRSRVYLRVDEYMRMLSVAGGNLRHYAILQLFLQTGIRVSELVNLTLADVDLSEKRLRIVQGKGKKDRQIPLEKKAVGALKSYLVYRPQSPDPRLFLNYEGTGISDRGVQKLIAKYRHRAGIEKKVSCHSLRHTFGTYKAEHGVSPFQLQEWLGHTNLSTTQLYVHMSKQNDQRVMEATSL